MLNMILILIIFWFLLEYFYTEEVIPHVYPMSDIYQKSLDMHQKLRGKLRTEAIAHIETRDDLSWAYSPWVAEPCREIAKDPRKMYDYTLKSRTIAVI